MLSAFDEAEPFPICFVQFVVELLLCRFYAG